MGKRRLQWTDADRRIIRKRMARLKEQAAGVFHYPKDRDAQVLDFVMLPAIALHWAAENPLWAQVIGAPGSGKTAHISLLDTWDNAKFVSRLSKNSLISGFRDEKDPDKDMSLLPLLNGKLLVVKDFTCILQGPREERDAVIGQLRDVFDGSASRAFGNIGLVEYQSRFNMLLAVTNVIDGFYSVNTQLGERFISRREYSDGREQITEAAIHNIIHGRNTGALDDLKEEFVEFITTLPTLPINAIQWSVEMLKRIKLAANMIAQARSHVIREKDGKSIATKASPEVGTRLATQIVQCIAGYCIVNGIEEVNLEAWDFGGARVLRDTLPTAVAWILYHMYLFTIRAKAKGLKGEFNIKDLVSDVRLGWNTIAQITTDLHHNGILDVRYFGRTGRREPKYKLTDKAYEHIKFLRLFHEYEDDEVGIDTLAARLHAQERTRKVHIVKRKS